MRACLPATARGGIWASSALAQLLPAVALGPALLAVPAPHLDTRLTHAFLLATSFLPATAAAPSLPTALPREPRPTPPWGSSAGKVSVGVRVLLGCPPRCCQDR